MIAVHKNCLATCDAQESRHPQAAPRTRPHRLDFIEPIVRPFTNSSMWPYNKIEEIPDWALLSNFNYNIYFNIIIIM